MTRTDESARGSVYLVGFMAVGKSTIGRRLAVRLDRPFVDLDERVEVSSGLSIAELWADIGEEGFRDLESEVLGEVAGQRVVVATGGGAVVRSANRELLARTGFILWLRAPYAVILKRGCGRLTGTRPLWRADAEGRALLEQRETLYACAHRTVEVGGDEPGAVASRLAELVHAWESNRCGIS